MPKIIENLPERLLLEAQRQVQENGYSAMTIRSVATACHVGVGTVYNYYPSKDALVAAFMLEDWLNCLDSICTSAQTAAHREDVLLAIYNSLTGFTKRHEALFRDAAAAASFGGAHSKYHALLRAQLATPLARFCQDGFTAEFIAESMLTWAVAGKPFDALHSILQHIP